MVNKRVSYACARSGNMVKENQKLTQSEAMAFAHKEYDQICNNENFSEWEGEYEHSEKGMSYGQFIARKGNTWR